MATLRTTQRIRTLQALGSFFATDLATALAGRDEAEASVLALARSVAREVPAYADWLAAHDMGPDTIRTIEDFRRLPIITKDNYHRPNALARLCRHGALEACDMLAVSSGSTGHPAVWPRFVTDELATARRFEQVLADAFEADRKTTLGVVCFALGSWVGGMYTTDCCRHLAALGYPLTLVTPGNNVAEILRVLRELGDRFDQVVLFGYPPFLKDVIDAGIADGHAWNRVPTRLVMAGEVYSESFRALVCERLGAGDPARATAALYGTADGGVLANETPWSIRIRQALADRPEVAQGLFGEARLPTLAQYDPCHRFFEVEQDGSLLFSGDGSVPLVRYKILDRGGVLEPEAMHAFLADHGITIAAPEDEPRRALPFVWVFGRSSFAISFYGANVYPENVAPALERPDVARHLTGKFVLEVLHDHDENARLRVTVELARGSDPPGVLAIDLASAVHRELERTNSEFRHYVPDARRTPDLVLRPFGDPADFPTGVKHRYTRS